MEDRGLIESYSTITNVRTKVEEVASRLKIRKKLALIMECRGLFAFYNGNNPPFWLNARQGCYRYIVGGGGGVISFPPGNSKI